MLYLLAAIIGSSSLVILLKLFDLKGVNMYVGITMNYIVGAALALLFSPVRFDVGEITSAGWLPMSLIVGAMFTLSFVVYAFSAQRSGVAITTISGRAAVVIPVVFAFAVLGAEVTALKIVLLAVILFAMVLILRKGKSGGEVQRHLWMIWLPIGVFLFNGANDTLVQYAQKELIPAGQYPLFMAVMFLASALTGLICYGISAVRRPHAPTWRDVLWGSLLGFMNWVCMIGVFNGLDYVDGSVFYPIYYTGAIVLATIAGVWAFKERLSRVNYAGIVLAVAAIAVLSML
jgi:multidrug transporter EmrE-like cation transporter